MKVILLQDVARIGRRFEIKNVPDGHALNFLIPRKLAESGAPGSIKRLESRRGKIEETKLNEGEAFAETLEKLSAEQFSMSVEANEQGHLFKGIKAEDIAKAITDAGGFIAASNIQLDAVIKAIGTHEVNAVLGEKRGVFSLIIEAK